MKTSRLLASIIAVLMTAGVAIAQSTQPSYVVPKSRGGNFFIDVGVTDGFASLSANGNSSSVNLYGVTAVFGLRLNTYNKIQAEVDGLYGSQSKTFGGVSVDAKYTMIPEMFVYSVCIPLSRDGRWELRLSPSIGTALIYTRYDTDTPRLMANDADLAVVYGVGVGASYHLNRRVYVDFGLRYLHVGETSYNWGKLDSFSPVTLSAAIGWKF